ncbi:MAG: nucleotidyltransferase family protein [Promethearchaeota archaeon]
MLNKELTKKIVTFLEKNGVRKISLFGSYVRGEKTADNDINIIVGFPERKNLLDIVRIEQELTEEIDIKVDLLTEKPISPYLIESIKKKLKVISE